MATFLFDSTIFGPVQSRRLGVSLGVNLLPNDQKVCSFDCIYCECGWNPKQRKQKAVLPTRQEFTEALEAKLQEMVSEGKLPDVITFAGNGEPTLHPKFTEIISDTLVIRDRYAKNCRIAVLSNSTMLHKPSVVEALKTIDDNILKLDSAIANTVEHLDCPNGNFNIDQVIDQLGQFNQTQIIQTMFLRGSFKGVNIDNTTEEEIDAWIKALKRIQPAKVMIYTIARDTPLDTIEKISIEEMQIIADRVEKELGLTVEVSG